MKLYIIALLLGSIYSQDVDKTDLRVDNYLSFDEAFEVAYLHLGPDATFEWRGQTYSTDTAEKVSVNAPEIEVLEDIKPKYLPLVNKESLSENEVTLNKELPSPWGVYIGILSMGFSEEDSKRISGMSAGLSYKINDRVTQGIGLTQRGFKQRAEIYYSDDDYDDCFSDYCAPEYDYFDTVTFSGIELWTTYDLVSTQNMSVWTGLSYAYLFEREMNDFYSDDYKYISDESEHDYGLMLGLTAKNKYFSTNISYYKAVSDFSFDNLSLNVSLPLNFKKNNY